MGMSTHVVGFMVPTADYARKVAAWRACKAAGVEPPAELVRMFDGDEPDDAGQEIGLGHAVEEWLADGCEGYQVRLDRVPKGVTMIRFYNSW